MNIFLGMVGPWQVVIIVALILLLFGGKKIPELMRGLGTGIREFKDATKDPAKDPAKDNERIGKPEDEQINKSAN
jgi:twin arginine-targeting protein translocase, tatA/E family